MHDRIAARAVATADFIISKKATVRAAAKQTGVSKSTVYKDVTERLQKINPALAGEVIAVISQNKAERHIRGGMATKEKYLKAISP